MEQGEGKNSAETPNTIPSSESEVIDQYGTKIKGMKSKCGIVIGDISSHAAKRIIDRKVSLEALEDLILNAPILHPGNKPNTTCQQKDNLRLILGNIDGTIVSIVDLT